MRARIVIIDAEPVVRTTIASILESDGYESRRRTIPWPLWKS